ncbi:class I SAM-dependent methyltransferase [Patescibacteria group bacterium]|nr:class I SAM-dependent methyltransferase [Patescibacteria group bacterium]
MIKNILRFEREYFDHVYQGEYRRRNPNYKQRSFLKKILKFKTKGSLLDVGCAYGFFLDFARDYFEIEGVDISSHAISVAKKKLPRETKLRIQKLEKMKLAGKFDVITCFDVLEHLENVDQALKVVERYLKNDGILVITVPVYDGPVGKLVNLADKDKTHLQKKSRRFWLDELTRHGFKIKLFNGIFRYFLLRWLYLNWVSGLISNFSPAIFIIAEKENKKIL